ncbi:NB-ARC domain-containing protein [Actinoplanes sp. NPDC024001]|uniref:ATP-binding protein n=1 Tax=Actinoplanes sp. NPDC024001 TaxID=3154598 RepID=UPI0034008E75
MRERGVLVSLVITSSLLPVALGVAVNVATGGTLPGPLRPLTALAWPVVGVLTVITAALAIWQARHSAAPAAPVPARPAPADLPLPPAGLAGRDAELAELARWTTDGVRVIAITGPAGVGKSALALRLATQVGARFPDGRLFTDLGAGRTTADVLAWFLAGFGERVDPALTEQQLLRRYRSVLAGKRVLVVLDDAPASGVVRPLLPTAPGCLAIVTSRRPLTGLDEAVHLPVAALPTAAAVELLAGLAGSDRVAREPAAAEQVVRACGALPLAVRIAGARLAHRPAWSVADLAARLADERSRLDELHTGDLAVRSSFRASYDDLPAPDRRAFRRLGAISGRSFDTATAAAALGPPDRAATAPPGTTDGPGRQRQPGGAAAASPGTTDDPGRQPGGAAAASPGKRDEPGRQPGGAGAALERLVDAGLLEPSARDRYRLHDLLRLFAHECLIAEESPAERAAALERLVDRYAGLVTGGAAAEITAERDALVAMLARAVDDGRPDAAWRLWQATERSATLRADYRFRLAAGRQAVRATEAGDDARRQAHALWRLGRATDLVGGAAQAVDLLSRALHRWVAGTDENSRCRLRCDLANALGHVGRLDDAAEQARTARSGFARLDDAASEA